MYTTETLLAPPPSFPETAANQQSKLRAALTDLG
jgi:hypothetical protein